MIDENTKLEVGGRVKISGVWHEVHLRDSGNPVVCLGKDPRAHRIPANRLMEVIEEYAEPEEAPYEWLYETWTPLADVQPSVVSLNAGLTALYGDPRIRTYSGEDSARYGLTEDCFVLYYCQDNVSWARRRFRYLEAGVKWRKQPASPKREE